MDQITASMQKSRNAFRKAKGLNKKVCKACQTKTFHNLHSIVTSPTSKNEWVSNSELEARDQDYLVDWGHDDPIDRNEWDD